MLHPIQKRGALRTGPVWHLIQEIWVIDPIPMFTEGPEKEMEWKWCTNTQAILTLRKQALRNNQEDWQHLPCLGFRRNKLMLSKHVKEPIIRLIHWYSWMDWPTTDWLRPFLTDLFPHSEKCKMGKDEHFGSERRLTLSPCFCLLSEKWMREREHSKEISRTLKKPICPSRI